MELIEKVKAQVAEMVEKYDRVLTEIDVLRTKVTTLEAEKEAKEQYITMLEGRMNRREVEMEEIAQKIANALNK
jgi:hypothetical protein